MSLPFTKCPTCGSNLDPGERCTCNGRKITPAVKEKLPEPQLSQGIETCRECGLIWNVSIHVVIPPSGYLCPVCKGKQRKGANT